MSEDDKVSERLYEWLQEAADLRWGVGESGSKLSMPAYEHGQQGFVLQLLNARQRADRVEELLHNAKRVKARLLAAQKEALDELQEKKDRALAEGAVSAREYSMGDERRAEANIKSFAERRAERAAARRLAVAVEVVEAINDIHWGLSGYRSDLRDVLRSFQLESNLER